MRMRVPTCAKKHVSEWVCDRGIEQSAHAGDECVCDGVTECMKEQVRGDGELDMGRHARVRISPGRQTPVVQHHMHE